MQQHRGQLDAEEEIQKMEYQLYSVERDRDKAVNENATLEINKRDTDIECLKLELEKTKVLAETIEKLRSDLAGRECRVRDLESEMERGKEFGTKMLDSVMIHMKKLEEAEKEIEGLRKQVKLAMVVEETSKKALDDLALALKEVGTEASEAKEALGVVKGEEERLKLMVEEYKNMGEQLRIEAEAWNEKEAGLVECLRIATQENCRLLQLAETRKQENAKLRDILKQALRASIDTTNYNYDASTGTTSPCTDHKGESDSETIVEKTATPSSSSSSSSTTNSKTFDDLAKTETSTGDGLSIGLGLGHDLNNNKNKRKLGLVRRFGDLILLRKTQSSPPNQLQQHQPH